MRVVIDRSVLVAAIRSPAGASSALLHAVLAGQLRPLISVPLVLEYEAVITRPEHLAVSQLTAPEAITIVKAFCLKGEPVHLTHRLRPQLFDPDEEFVLETAYHGDADVIVTINLRDFAGVAEKFGIQPISPREALERMRSQ